MVLNSASELETVLFAQPNTREQSSKMSGARLKTKSEIGERVFFSRLTRLDIDFEGKNRLFCSLWSK